jgi:tight adherence protein C
MLPVLIGVLIFIVVTLLVGMLLRPKTAAITVQERATEYLLSAPAAPRQDDSGFGDRVVLPGLRVLGRLLSMLAPAHYLKKIRTKLDMAGNPSNYGVLEYIGTKALSMAVIIPLGFWGVHLLAPQTLVAWLLWVIIAGVGIWLPDIVLQRIIESRQLSIRRALPEMLDLLVISVEAGVSFDGAVQTVVEKGNGPLHQECARVLEQVRLGKSRSDALREMAQRTQVDDLTSFVAAITQAEVLGISIAKVLRTQADTARERRAHRAREMGARLPVKLLFPLVFFIFPSLFVVILGPGVIRFADLFQAMGR